MKRIILHEYTMFILENMAYLMKFPLQGIKNYPGSYCLWWLLRSLKQQSISAVLG